MKQVVSLLILFLVIPNIAGSFDQSAEAEKYWPQWRGPFASGIYPHGDPPSEWSETKNIKWKIALPGKGHATPIIWQNQLFIQTAVPVTAAVKPAPEKAAAPGGRSRMSGRNTDILHRFMVLSLERDTGKILWQRIVKEEVPEEATHEFGSWASNSPITDGEHLYAYFGSRGLYCLDLQGKVKWERDFGQMEKRREFGEGSSPGLMGDKLFIIWDHEGDSFLVAIDKKTGQDIWRIKRNEPSSWSTPFIVDVKGSPQVIINAANRIRAYAPDTGKVIWECGGMTLNVIPCPVYTDGLLYLMSGFRGSALVAIRLADAQGDITGTDAVVWQYNQDTPYTPSPLLINNRLYFLRVNSGALTCLNAKTGAVFYAKKRLEGIGSIFTSPVQARDRIYIVGQGGTMYVIQEGPIFKIQAINRLDDNFIASPVIYENQLYLRGYKYLYCIAKQ